MGSIPLRRSIRNWFWQPGGRELPVRVTVWFFGTRSPHPPFSVLEPGPPFFVLPLTRSSWTRSPFFRLRTLLEPYGVVSRFAFFDLEFLSLLTCGENLGSGETTNPHYVRGLYPHYVSQKMTVQRCSFRCHCKQAPISRKLMIFTFKLYQQRCQWFMVNL